MLPAPRDPHAPEAVPPDPPPLAPRLTALLRSAGAQALHAVDGGRGEVLVEVGLADGDDVPSVVQLAKAATALGRGRGEWLEDLVVTLGRTVHVLRECDGVVLHARLDPASGDVGAVRRGLASADLVRAAEAAGRAARAVPAGPPGAGAGAPAPAAPLPRGTHRREEAGPAAAPRPAAPAGRAPRPRPAAETGWPYSVPEPDPAPAVAPGRRPAHSAEARRAAEPADPARDEGTGPARDPLDTAPAMRAVPPQPRRVPARPLPSVPAPARPHPISRPTPLPTPRQTPPVSQRTPQPRPSPQPRSGRVPEPPRVPLPRSAGGPAPAGRDPALVTVDGGMPLTGTGALAVLALPSAATRSAATRSAAAPSVAAPDVAAPSVAPLPHRRRVAPARPAPSPRGFVTPPVLRQPWASDVPTMRRMLAGLARLN